MAAGQHLDTLDTDAVVVLALWVRARGAAPRLRAACGIAAVIAVLQVALGITTLLLEVPVAWGAAHQAGALVLLTALLWCAFVTRGARQS